MYRTVQVKPHATTPGYKTYTWWLVSEGGRTPTYTQTVETSDIVAQDFYTDMDDYVKSNEYPILTERGIIATDPLA